MTPLFRENGLYDTVIITMSEGSNDNLNKKIQETMKLHENTSGWPREQWEIMAQCMRLPVESRRTGRETEDNQKEEKVEKARKDRSHEMQGKRVTFCEDQ